MGLVSSLIIFRRSVEWYCRVEKLYFLFDIWQFYTTFASSYLHTAIEAFDCLLVIEKRKDEKIQ